MSNALAVVGPKEYMPVMSFDDSARRYNALVEFTKKAMVAGKDYGVIPGSSKPTLLKPGAEKLCTFFGLTIPDPVILKEEEDWTGENHGGEAFFYYKILQRLERNGEVVASQFASCNSWESKYRYRKAERVCPQCGKPTVFKSKPPKQGYYCWLKKGGCGLQFQAGDQSIESQVIGRVLNADVADVVNTVQKMAQKRALIAATLLAVNASEFFTQDLEDIPVEVHDDGEIVEHDPPRREEKKSPDTITRDDAAAINDLVKKHHADVKQILADLHITRLGELARCHLSQLKADIARGRYSKAETTSEAVLRKGELDPAAAERVLDAYAKLHYTPEAIEKDLMKVYGVREVRHLTAAQAEEIITDIEKELAEDGAKQPVGT